MQDNRSPSQIDPWLRRALSHPKRVEALSYLTQKQEGTGDEELADALGTSAPLTLYHLRILRDADLIAQVEDRRRQGKAISWSRTRGQS